MHRRLLLTVFAGIVAAASLRAQPPNGMRASIRGGGGDEGKCTIEVVVDGAVEVEIRGDRANMRNLWGQPPQWRRFECNRPMPDRPGEFRFKGIDGRGRQELVRDPRSGGPAVVRIEDRDGGSEGYTFDLIWREGGGSYPDSRREPYPDRGPGRRFTVEQAVGICREAVRSQAYQRFGARDVDFRRIDLDDNPGRRDWVVGSFEAQRGRYDRDLFQFACSVDFDSGRVRSVQIDRVRDRR
jgi:hypothetical protein